MTLKGKFKYVFFDADDTLWENESYNREAEHRFALLLSSFVPEKDACALIEVKQEENIPRKKRHVPFLKSSRRRISRYTGTVQRHS